MHTQHNTLMHEKIKRDLLKNKIKSVIQKTKVIKDYIWDYEPILISESS